MMNKRAKELGLAQSHLRQSRRAARPAGPDDERARPGQAGAPSDQRLSANIITISASRSFIWHNITQPNRDLVLDTLPGADGLKTGHTDAAGYGITISAKRGDQRFILVLNGLRYPQYHNDYFPNIKRAEEAGRVMEMAFREFRSLSAVQPPTRWWARRRCWTATSRTCR